MSIDLVVEDRNLNTLGFETDSMPELKINVFWFDT